MVSVIHWVDNAYEEKLHFFFLKLYHSTLQYRLKWRYCEVFINLLND
jgi:hypothetical protein